MVKKLGEIQDGALMVELGINPNQISGITDVEKIEMLEGIKSSYNLVLMNLLELDIDINKLSEEKKKELGLTGSGKDIFVTVDENDIPNGFEFRALCHNGVNTQNKIHRAADWIVVNEKFDILLSKRAGNKDSYPGYWEIGGGHIDGFDSYEITLKRELEEELGLGEKDIQEIQPLMKFLHKEEQQQQFIKVFVVRVKDTSQIVPEDGETEGQEFISEKEMLENIINIFDGNNPKYKMIPHQIFCILMNLKNRGKNVDELLQSFENWKKSNPTIELDKLNLY